MGWRAIAPSWRSARHGSRGVDRQHTVQNARSFLTIFAALALVLIPVAVIFVTYLKVTRSVDTLRNLGQAETLHDFLTSKVGLRFVMIWSIAESFYWWVFPDYLMMLTGVYVRKFHPKVVLHATVGSAIGGVAAYLTGRWFPSTSATILSNTPFINEKMRLFTDQKFEEQGALGVIHHPASGVPFKVFAHKAGQRDLDFVSFMSVGVSLRASRFALAYGVSFLLAKIFGERIRKLPARPVLVFYTVLFTVALRYVSQGRRLKIK